MTTVESHALPGAPSAPTGTDESVQAKTWLYLRLGMIALPLGIGSAVVWEWLHSISAGGGHCLQGSLSAYYYTPVSPIFVGALVGIGLCLFTLQGSTTLDDVLLDLAGMLAPIVALVPTRNPGHCSSDQSLHSFVGLGESNPSVIAFRDGVVRTGMLGLLIMVWAGMIVMLLLACRSVVGGTWFERGVGETVTDAAARIVGYPALAAVWVVATVLFVSCPGWFRDQMHLIAAGSALGAVLAVVVGNAVHSDSAPYRRAYVGIAGGMVFGGLFFFAHSSFQLAPFATWGTWLLWLEVWEIGLFAAFWLTQTLHKQHHR